MLPEPEAEALAASALLVERIRAEVKAGGGWIAFSRYMELALHAPGLGYYAGGAAKLGAPGDFATAPEMGSLFARTLARQVSSLLQPGEAIDYTLDLPALSRMWTRPNWARISGRLEVALLRRSVPEMTVTPTGRSRFESGKRVAVTTTASSWARQTETKAPARKPATAWRIGNPSWRLPRRPNG